MSTLSDHNTELVRIKENNTKTKVNGVFKKLNWIVFMVSLFDEAKLQLHS